MVGDIDLTSNQMLDFLEYFIEEISYKITSKLLKRLLILNQAILI
jgi:hypothetical protein